MALPRQSGHDGKPETKEAYLLEVGEMPNGARYEVPVLVATGSIDGPKLFVNAGMHGDEILGGELLRQVFAEIDPTSLRGQVIFVPSSNYSGMATRTRRNVLEMYPGPHDMNRVFPGDAHGIMTERIAAILMERFVDEADYAFDVHCASVGGEWQAYTGIPRLSDCSSEEVQRRSEALAIAFGTPIVLDGLGIPGSFLVEGPKRGTPTSMVELGVANVIDEENLALGLRGITNLLKHLDMLDGEPEVPAERLKLRSMSKLRTDHAGYLMRKVQLGDDVEEGDVIATVEDLLRETMQTFTAPVSGRVCRINTMGIVGTGDLVAYVGSSA